MGIVNYVNRVVREFRYVFFEGFELIVSRTLEVGAAMDPIFQLWVPFDERVYPIVVWVEGGA